MVTAKPSSRKPAHTIHRITCWALTPHLPTVAALAQVVAEQLGPMAEQHALLQQQRRRNQQAAAARAAAPTSASRGSLGRDAGGGGGGDDTDEAEEELAQLLAAHVQPFVTFASDLYDKVSLPTRPPARPPARLQQFWGELLQALNHASAIMCLLATFCCLLPAGCR